MNDELKVFGINMLGTVAWLDEVVMLSHLSETAVDDPNQFVTRKRRIMNKSKHCVTLDLYLDIVSGLDKVRAVCCALCCTRLTETVSMPGPGFRVEEERGKSGRSIKGVLRCNYNVNTRFV